MSLYNCVLENDTVLKNIPEDVLNHSSQKISKFINHLNNNKKENPLFSTLYEEVDLEEIYNIVDKIKSSFKHILVIGMGGSILNPQSLVLSNSYNQGAQYKGLKISFLDNIDPDFTDSILSEIKLEETAFLIISKSGNTIETVSQFLVCMSLLEKNSISDIAKRVYIISEKGDNNLRNIGEEIGACILDHHSEIGGRYATFTNVGLLPAALAGMDIKKFRSAAIDVLQDLFTNKESFVKQAAIFSYFGIKQGFNITVMMPYIKSLYYFTSWFRQLWSESLGKKGFGSTPIRALGTIDQHSQLQLYLDGPKDKLFTIISMNRKGDGNVISSKFIKDTSLDYIRGKTIGDINTVSQNATIQILKNRGCPLRIIEVESVDESVLGALHMHFMLETMIVAHLLDLNPFTQESVEEGKLLIKSMLEEKS